MKYILIGFKNCGKTQFGQYLAKRLTLPFIDIDQEIEKKHQALTGESLQFYEIYHSYGEGQFREYEKTCIKDLSTAGDAVISTGGGSLLDSENISKLQQIGTFIYLKASKEELLARMQRNRLPEFIDSHDPEHSFNKAYEARKKVYEQIADVELLIDHKSNELIFEDFEQQRFKEAIVG